ncbi:DUF397 domain-containing protein [Pseudonocardia sp. CNS-139]|nr:DUF397 domain-containing protein [Pseudonocardia sp. CNS-139]
MAGLRWRKSTHSNDNGSCVELAALADGSVAVRDSKHPDGSVLTFTRGEIRAWLDAARAGEYDDLAPV